MYHLVRILLGALAAANLVCGAAQPPNILLLLTDDQSYEAARYAGRLEIETPHLDRLASRGISFTHAYNMGSWTGAICVASRTMLHTGRTLWSAEKVSKSLNAERKGGRLWATALHHAGYETYFTGKWHVAVPPGKVFDHCARLFPGMPPTVPAAYHRPPPSGREDTWRPDDRANGGYWKGGTHWSEVTADSAISFLGQAKRSDKPFFLCVAFNAPHDPRQAPTEYLARYNPATIDVPPSFLPAYPHARAMDAAPPLRDEILAPFPRTEAAIRTHRREYYALVTHLDAQIGRILDALESTGQAAETWVFLTSDHGLSCGHHGLMGKQNPYDVSIRVPLLVAGPGVPAGGTSDTPVYLQDIMPTTLELANIDVPDHVGFRSLLPHIRSEGRGRESILFAYTDRQRAIVRGGWKLILYPQGSVVRLYHLAADPLETADLAADPRHRERIRSLFAGLVEQQEELGDPLDLTTAYPDL